MRLLIEVLIVGALVYVGWATPLRDYFPASVSGIAKSPNVSATSQAAARQQQPESQPTARSSPAQSGAWMWDANHRSTLDRPTPKPSPH